MAKNHKYTQLDYQQAFRHCIDEDNDALRIVIINPSEVKKEEVNANLKELIDVLKIKDIPQDRTDYSKLIENVDKLTQVSLTKKEVKQEFIPKWVKIMIVFQTLSTFGVLISNLIKH